MKKLTISLFASLALAATTFAGHEIVSSKDNKEMPITNCFNDHELQLDVFGMYLDGNAPTHAGPIRDHAWGGGIGVNYFFTRYIGVGVEGYAVGDQPQNREVSPNDHKETFYNVNGSFIFRMPIDRICLAPYAYLGGGASIDGDSRAVGFVGVGLEYRVVPNKIGIFADVRWNYYGDFGQRDVQNNFGTRAGLRFVF